LDKASGFLRIGDSFYGGTIWLYFPAHNTPRANPEMLLRTLAALDTVFQEKAIALSTWEGVVTFKFDGFGFLMRTDYISPAVN